MIRIPNSYIVTTRCQIRVGKTNSIVDHKTVYGGVPPVGVTEAVPLFCPLHTTSVKVKPDTIEVGSKIVIVAVVTVFLSSVTVNVWVPGTKLVTEAIVSLEGDQE